MGAREDLNSAMRNLLIGVTDATDAKVINAGPNRANKGPRPGKPYVTVRVTSPGGTGGHGPAERIDGLNGLTPQATMRERREASISLQAFGTGAIEWLNQMQIRLDAPASITLQRTNAIAAILLTPVTDLGALLDTAEEQRASLELTLRHQYADDPADQVELLGTEVTVTLERFDGDADTLDASFGLDDEGDLTTPP